jgi:molybdopterin converting factor small subunit
MTSVLTVRLFARYAEVLGNGSDRLELSADRIATVADLLKELQARPGGSVIGPSTLVAVNLRQVRRDTPIAPGDEIALLPPLAGG